MKKWPVTPLYSFSVKTWSHVALIKLPKTCTKKYGEIRVLDTPLPKIALPMAVGAAMTGLRPIIEGMNMAFAACLQPDFQQRWNAPYLGVTKPMVIRGPAVLDVNSVQNTPAARSLLQAVPGLKIVACSTSYNAKGLLKAAIRDDNPVVL